RALNLVANDRALRQRARHVDGIVLALARSFEARIFLDRQRTVEDVAFDDGGAFQLHPAGADRTLDLTADGEIFRDQIAFDAGAFVDQNGQRAQFALDLAEHVQGTLANDLSHHGHAATDGG